MNGIDRPDGPDDVDVLFGEIVADLRAEGVGASADVDDPGQAPEVGEPAARVQHPDGDWRGSEVGWDETMLSADPTVDDDEEHFVPPEPPPLPTPGPGGLLMMLLFGLGLLLLIAPGFIGLGSVVGTPLGLLLLAAGLGVIVLRGRENLPPGSDPENGSQV